MTSREVLSKNISLHKKRFPDKEIKFNLGMLEVVHLSMNEFALKVKKEDNLQILKRAIPGLGYPLWLRFSFWVKKLVREQYVKAAKHRSTVEGYKIYVLQGSGLTFKLISSREMKHNKRVRVFRKDLTAKEMEELSCFVAYPK